MSHSSKIETETSKSIQIVLEKPLYNDLALLGASQSEIHFITALEAGETEGDTPLVDVKEIVREMLAAKD